MFNVQRAVHGGNDYVQCSKGRNSKSRQIRVTVHMLFTSSHGALYLCEVSRKYHERYQLWSGHQYMVDMAIFIMFKGP